MSSDVKNQYYYQVLTDVKDYQLTFPDYVQSVSLTQNNFGNFADLSVSGKGIGYDLQMSYSSDPASSTFSGVVSRGEYSGSTVTITTSKTWSFYTKVPDGGTKIHAELKLKNSGLFSALSFVSDDSIKFGLQQALDKVGDRAKVIQQKNIGTTQLVATTPTQTTTTPSSPPITTPPSTTNIPTPTPTPISPQPTPSVTTPSPAPKLPIITLYSSSVNGMTVTIYGDAHSGSGKTLSNISFNWGDGQSSTGQFPQTHTYSQAGTYTTTATVIDSGLSSSITTNVVISTPTQQAQPPQTTQPTPPQSTVTIKTDLSNYKTGDTIVITGHVTNLNSASAVTIRIVNPSQNLVLVTQIVPSSDGSFTTTATTNGSLWQPSGTFTVIAQYGSANIMSQTTFYFTYTPTPSNPAPSNTQPSGTPIGDIDYKVSAGTYTPIPFTLSCSATVSGTFSSTAGLGDDIMIFIFDQNNLQKFTSNSYTAYYESGKVGTGSFNINLTPGTYYIVLSNLYSSFSTKNVHIQASYTCN